MEQLKQRASGELVEWIFITIFASSFVLIVVLWFLQLPDFNRIHTAQRDLRNLRHQLQRYHEDVGLWPPFYAGDRDYLTAIDQFQCLVEGGGIPNWNGPYLSEPDWEAEPKAKAAPTKESDVETGIGIRDEWLDPWGQPYAIRYFRRRGVMGHNGGVVLISYGENRVFETPASVLAMGRASGDDLVLPVTNDLDLANAAKPHTSTARLAE